MVGANSIITIFFTSAERKIVEISGTDQKYIFTKIDPESRYCLVALATNQNLASMCWLDVPESLMEKDMTEDRAENQSV